MSQLKRKQREIKAEINIIPFLDVLLVLLLIFIASSPIISQSVKVDLPDTVKTENIDSQSNRAVILEVTKRDVYTLYTASQIYNDLTAQDVISLARQERNSNPRTIFLLAGARKAPYNDIINALNLLHSAGIKSVGLMTNPLSKTAEKVNEK